MIKKYNKNKYLYLTVDGVPDSLLILSINNDMHIYNWTVGRIQ